MQLYYQQILSFPTNYGGILKFGIMTRSIVGKFGQIFYRSYHLEVMSSGLKVIDFRSDTVTKPSTEMRNAMAIAELEQRCADLFGMEAALFVPSGSMANLIAIMVHCNRRGSEIIVGDKQHIHKYEQAGYAQLAGVGCYSIANASNGTIPLESITKSIRDRTDFHQSWTQLICLENTHNGCGGRVLPLDYMKEVRAIADANDIKVHVDGARLYNAAVVSGHTPAQLLKYAHSTAMCLSKGLGAPVGSVLGGTKDFIDESLRVRKALGGAMRQVGVLAAAGLVALDTAEERLKLDHHNAKLLAKGINEIGSPLFQVDEGILETNIILLNTKVNSEEVCQKLKLDNGFPVVLVDPLSDSCIRLVTHCDVSTSDIHSAVSKFENIVKMYSN